MMSYNSKVLLFGEHIVNMGANALAIPFANYSCTLVFDKNEADVIDASTEILEKTLNYISNQESLNGIFNLVAFKDDITKGLCVKMNIPFGFGLGSSGAYVSCIYEKYCQQKSNEINTLQTILGQVESVFHGKSSGLDPLVSYLNQPILIEQGSSKTIAPLECLTKDFRIFLVNTGKSRSTAPLVTKFLARVKEDSDFEDCIKQEIVPLNNEIIAEIVAQSTTNTLDKIKRLSALQLKHFSFLITEEYRSIWEDGLKNDSYYLKICGAGGGGMMLGFQNKAQSKPEVFDPIYLD